MHEVASFLSEEKRRLFELADSYPEVEPDIPDGWFPMRFAPKGCIDVDVLLKDRTVVVAHFAQDLSGEEQPIFSGWFKSDTRVEVRTR